MEINQETMAQIAEQVSKILAEQQKADKEVASMSRGFMKNLESKYGKAFDESNYGVYKHRTFESIRLVAMHAFKKSNIAQVYRNGQGDRAEELAEIICKAVLDA